MNWSQPTKEGKVNSHVQNLRDLSTPRTNKGLICRIYKELHYGTKVGNPIERCKKFTNDSATENLNSFMTEKEMANFVHARQALYQLSHSPALLLFLVCFPTRVSRANFLGWP
jgi:DNA phosphorothioation-dependent restriction protein DptG